MVCLWAGCSHTHPEPADTGAGPYVGSGACTECHPEIAARQATTNHALSLRAPTERWLKENMSAATNVVDQETGLTYGFRAGSGGEYAQVVRQGEQEVARARIDYLLGSGRHATSPVTYQDATWAYLSLTHYGSHGWDFSPMHELGDAEARKKNSAGWPMSSDEMRKCYSCHTTRLEFSRAGLDPARTELGVRCEACHGPGRAHVEAARARKPAMEITHPGKWSVQSSMALCEQCHNQSSTLDGVISGISDDPADPTTVKYHVYGLGRSRCFTQSPGGLRCTSCHDPHSNAETTPAFYEVRCLGCHSPEQKRTACPISPRKGCLPCHMPKVKVERHTYFADHWIRAHSPFAKHMDPGERASDRR